MREAVVTLATMAANTLQEGRGMESRWACGWSYFFRYGRADDDFDDELVGKKTERIRHGKAEGAELMIGK